MHSKQQDWDQNNMTGPSSAPRRPPPAFSIASSSLADEKAALAECARGASHSSNFTADEEKGVLGREMTDESTYYVPPPPRSHNATRTTPSSTPAPHSSASRHTGRHYIDDDDGEVEIETPLENKAVKLLVCRTLHHSNLVPILTTTTAPLLRPPLRPLSRPRTLDHPFHSSHSPHLPSPQTSSKELDSGGNIDIPLDLNSKFPARRHLHAAS